MKRAKNLPNAIQWHEGLLLAPQHFQQLAQRQEDALAYHVLAGLPYCWGVRKLDIDVGLLGAGTLRVTELEAIMPDGLIVSHASDLPGAELLELSLTPYAERLAQGGLMAFLAIEKTGNRFHSVPGELVTDEHSTSDPIEIPRLRPNLQLLAGDEPSARYVSFPLVLVVRENEVYKLGNFVPPRIEVSAESMLKKMCIELAVRLREKTVFLAKQTTIPSSRIEDRLQYLELRDRLRSIVTLLPYYEAVLETESIHPYPLYVALSALCGPLSLLRAGAVPPAPTPYRHTDLHATFATLVADIDGMLDAVSQSYRELKMKYEDGVFTHLIEHAWLGERLVIGVRAQSERDLLAWMEGALIGSDTILGPLREKRVLGAQRMRIERAEELGLDAVAGIALFAIQVDPNFILPDRPLMILNPGEGAAAQRPAEIILYVK
jgi:type VI secretion system protein ImpJ